MGVDPEQVPERHLNETAVVLKPATAVEPLVAAPGFATARQPLRSIMVARHLVVHQDQTQDASPWSHLECPHTWATDLRQLA
jgi:hypothetical protein